MNVEGLATSEFPVLHSAVPSEFLRNFFNEVRFDHIA